ncbi:MAG: metallophosphoesterase [Chloroflexota bacterium]
MSRLEIPPACDLWAVGDVHGQPAALLRALVRAGLADASGAWRGPFLAGLVILGDLVDRGPDSRGAVALVRSLQASARAAGASVWVVGGNHEELVADAARGEDADGTEVWLANGGSALCDEVGVRASPGSAWAGGAERIGRGLRAAAPDVVSLCADCADWAVWRDVALVHAGLPMVDDPVVALDLGFGRWDSSIRSLPSLRHPRLRPLRDMGIRRAVVGHVPTPGRAAVLCGGAVLSLDGNSGPTVAGAPSAIVVARLPESGPFSEEDWIVEPV